MTKRSSQRQNQPVPGPSKHSDSLSDGVFLNESLKRTWETLAPDAIVPLSSHAGGADLIPQPLRDGVQFINLSYFKPDLHGTLTHYDALQDVLFILQYSPIEGNSTNTSVNVQVKTLKSNGALVHPFASNSDLRRVVPHGAAKSPPKMSISGDHFAIFFQGDTELILIWNWKNGNQVANISIHLWEAKQGDRLSDFTFVSDRKFMLVGYKSLYLYSLSKTRHTAAGVLHLPSHECKPENGNHIRCYTAPFEGALPREYTPFELHSQERILVLEFRIQNPQLTAYIVINAVGLLHRLPIITKGTVRSGSGVDWTQWGPGHTTILNLPWEMRAIVDQRSINSARMIMSRMIWNDPPQYQHTLYDFALGRNSERTGNRFTPRSVHMTYDFHEDSRSASSTGEVFRHNVANKLPFSAAKLRPMYFRKYRRLILGGDYIIALLPTDSEVEKDAGQFEVDRKYAVKELEDDAIKAGYPSGTGELIFDGDGHRPDRYPFESCFFLF